MRMTLFSLPYLPYSVTPFPFRHFGPGDIVDRGPFSIELLVCLVMLKLHRPTAVHILRGNHETYERFHHDSSTIRFVYFYVGRRENQDPQGGWS